MIDPHEVSRNKVFQSCMDMLSLFASQTQESNYMFLLSLQNYAIEIIKEGAIIKDVYAQLVKKIRDEKPELEKHFVKTAGFTVRAYSPYRHQAKSR